MRLVCVLAVLWTHSHTEAADRITVEVEEEGHDIQVDPRQFLNHAWFDRDTLKAIRGALIANK